jgi:pimeloyl-ACP methyl ester carboxylesterase
MGHIMPNSAVAPVESFKVEIPQSALDDVRERLLRTRWPTDIANEHWDYGTNLNYLKELCDYWLHDYSWRSQEAKMNEFQHYRTTIDGNPIHFIREPGSGVKPAPLILTHGWPWTFWDFQKVIMPLAHPERFGGNAEDAFDVIVPSLPGYGFSTPLLASGVNFVKTADYWVTLMRDILGYQRFAAHGADWGMLTTEQLGHKHAANLIGIHLQLAAPLDVYSGGAPASADYGPGEETWEAKTANFFTNESGYAALQSTRPQTVTYAINDSPAGLCAWILEKRRGWSDCHGNVETRFSKDDLITTMMIYWLTQSYGNSARFYYEARKTPWHPSHQGMPVIVAPTGIMMFLNDLIGVPKRWAERYFNLHRWNVFPSGGHFGAMEEPAAVIEDIRAFFRPLRH